MINAPRSTVRRSQARSPNSVSCWYGGGVFLYRFPGDIVTRFRREHNVIPRKNRSPLREGHTKNDLRLNGKKVNGLYWGLREGGAEIEIDNDLGSSAVGTLVHELVHKAQRQHGVTPVGAFLTGGESLTYAASRVSDAVQGGYQLDPRKDFTAFWATSVLIREFAAFWAQSVVMGVP